MIGIGVAFFVCSYIQIATFSTAADNQTHRMRILFFKSILKQDITWFDTKTSGDFASKITADLDKIRDAIGDKVALCIYSLSTVLFSLGTAFYYGWELTLVMLSTVPIILITFVIIGKLQGKFSTTEADSYSKAGAVAEEVLGAIRTVYAFGGQTKEIDRYDKNLEPAKKSAVRRQMFTAIGLAVMFLGMFCTDGLAFWYGVRLIIRSIRDNNHLYDSGTMISVFFNVIMGVINLSQIGGYVDAFAMARGCAPLIFNVMKRVPEIDSSSESGSKLDDFKGRVELRSAKFSYPARPDVPVLKGLSLVAEPGQTVALVGPSGCGKSTVIQLIQRFYDVSDGQVLIDNVNIKDLNVGWLRDQIGVVGQEPVLFDCSIAENIKLGYSKAGDKDIYSSSKDANAYDFIMQLPKRFDTMVGERGSQLSGGQKQRIAIARALVRKPKILLLDESTSALDNQSESIVQAALDRASVGRTTFIVAHRLTTIRQADKIIAINSGIVEEVGTHEELMQKEGLYYNLVKSQQRSNDLDDKPTVDLPEKNGKQLLISRAFSVESGRDLTLRQRNGSVSQKSKKTDESAPLMRLIKLLKPDKWLATIGLVNAVICGLQNPIFSIIFGELLAILSQSNIDKLSDDTVWYALAFVVLGIGTGLTTFLNMYMFGMCGERLTMRLRKTVFKTMLQQEIGWYDQPDNSTGALCSRLSSDTASVQGASGARLSTLCNAIVTLGAGSGIALWYSWKLGLVISCFIPLILVATYFQATIIEGQITDDKQTQEEASRIAVEAIGSIRTVASLHRETAFIDNYTIALSTQIRRSRIRAHLRGATFGMAQSVENFSYAIALLYGSRLVLDGQLSYGDLFKCVEAVILGTGMVGQSVAFTPDYQKGKIAAGRIFKLLDRVPKIIVNPFSGLKPDKCEGIVKFSDLQFTYPTRPDQKILKGLSFEVSKGQTVALVGSSGCGKSTIIQLIQRFYDTDSGEIKLDNKSLNNLNIQWLRNKLGIVSQEPILFGYSIAENIAYGDNSRVVPMDEIVRAAEKANIHSFIKSLPMGYETPVGDKGTQLSGGQKQRIAIARALIRDPQILLLDEATSALDSESEKVVQQALDEAREGRTCIVIAHRLSTIQNADKIVVVAKGKVVEEGTHQQLLAKRGVYYELYTIQATAK
ncbi:ATP-dependent translocase ABCB1-like [Oppia nitens]|uniref:ATP-dependent translocase ABCB1-like n=1 Tax=Oppia nitens TaxID=1686743 RepID=UPI0023DB8928|nr:ATP-dependent translocase ABCB1-like [Oppia nitens]